MEDIPPGPFAYDWMKAPHCHCGAAGSTPAGVACTNTRISASCQYRADTRIPASCQYRADTRISASCQYSLTGRTAAARQANVGSNPTTGFSFPVRSRTTVLCRHRPMVRTPRCQRGNASSNLVACSLIPFIRSCILSAQLPAHC